MNGYKCFFGNKSVEVFADTSYQAQKKAVEIFKVSQKNAYKISVHLAEKNDSQVIHLADF